MSYSERRVAEWAKLLLLAPFLNALRMEVVTRIAGKRCHTVIALKLLKAYTTLSVIIEFGTIEGTSHHLKYHISGTTVLRTPTIKLL